jgi:hypothetical protein
MRTHLWIIALCLAAGLATPAWAQRTLGFGSNPSQLTFTPVDTSKAIATPIVTQQPQSFSLLNFVPSFSLPSFLTRKGPGVSPLPPPSSFPSTQYQSPIYPVAPIIPKN